MKLDAYFQTIHLGCFLSEIGVISSIPDYLGLGYEGYSKDTLNKKKGSTDTTTVQVFKATERMLLSL